jgi:hypothetical protein
VPKELELLERQPDSNPSPLAEPGNVNADSIESGSCCGMAGSSGSRPAAQDTYLPRSIDRVYPYSAAMGRAGHRGPELLNQGNAGCLPGGSANNLSGRLPSSITIVIGMCVL